MVNYFSTTPCDVGQLAADPNLYKNHFLFQKMCSLPYNFCRETDTVGWTNCVHIIHVRTMIFCTCNQIMFIINNIKKVFK